MYSTHTLLCFLNTINLYKHVHRHTPLFTEEGTLTSKDATGDMKSNKMLLQSLNALDMPDNYF